MVPAKLFDNLISISYQGKLIHLRKKKVLLFFLLKKFISHKIHCTVKSTRGRCCSCCYFIQKLFPFFLGLHGRTRGCCTRPDCWSILCPQFNRKKDDYDPWIFDDMKILVASNRKLESLDFPWEILEFPFVYRCFWLVSLFSRKNERNESTFGKTVLVNGVETGKNVY